MTNRKMRMVAKLASRERAAERAAARSMVRPPAFGVGDTIRSESGEYEVVGINSTGRVAFIQRLVAGRHDGAPFPRAMDERGIKIAEGEFARRVEEAV